MPAFMVEFVQTYSDLESCDDEDVMKALSSVIAEALEVDSNMVMAACADMDSSFSSSSSEEESSMSMDEMGSDDMSMDMVFVFFRFFWKKLNSRNVYNCRLFEFYFRNMYNWQLFDTKQTPSKMSLLAAWNTSKLFFTRGEQDKKKSRKFAQLASISKF